MNPDNKSFVDSAYELACKESKVQGREIHSVELLRKYLRLRPQDGWSWVLFAEALESIGRGFEAIGVYEKSIEFLPNEILHLRIGTLTKDHISLVEAESWYQLSTRTKKPPGYSWGWQGSFYAQLGNYEKAWECFQNALNSTESVDKDEIFYQMGCLAVYEQKYEEAITNFKVAIKIDPNYPGALIYLRSLEGMGETLIQVRKIRSIEDSEDIKSKMKFLDEIFEIAKMEFKAEDREIHAQELLQEYLKLRPHHADAWTLMGKCLDVHCRYKESINAFKKALDLISPESKYKVYPAMAKVIAIYESRKVAEELYRKAIDQSPTSIGWIWSWRARNLNQMGEYKKAINCYKEALDTAPSTFDKEDVVFEMGKILRGEGRYDEAETAFEEVLRINPENEDAKIALDGISDIEKSLEICAQLREMSKN